MNVYKTFDEVEQEIREQTPKTIYKYRDWGDTFHKKTITEREVWFAHPFKLNDPYDIRPPYNFIAENINWDIARQIIKEAGRTFEPHLSEEDLDIQVEIRLKDFKKDPIEYFKRNRNEYVLDKSHYDHIGVFSCCTSYGNAAMWAHYGNNHSGFAVGFNSVKLAKSLNCGLGYVNYDDKPIDYYILGDNEDIMNAEILQKSIKWSYEEEIRFITVGIGIYKKRANIYPLEALEEIVFGISTDENVQEDIIKIAHKSLPGISFYKVAINSDGFGLKKIKIL